MMDRNQTGARAPRRPPVFKVDRQQGPRQFLVEIKNRLTEEQRELTASEEFKQIQEE